MSCLRIEPLPDHRPPPLLRLAPEPETWPTLPLTEDPPEVAEAPADPQARAFAVTLVRAIVEVLGARRPPAQLTRWVSDELLGDVHLLARLYARSPERPRLCSVHVQFPRADAAEVAARLERAGRSSALALRLDRVGDRWLGQTICFGPPALVSAPVGVGLAG
ncbi:Rv3235 family protein [Granulicoccus phenolivorans]|uniref:Rv3235 family protein n=1 Tax=Granulicoccus phenolivorans TaxID=266854 RepID=UPI00041B2343|nr:Rv3235 family protein [Granulicoccus phenolivorans]